MLRLSAMGDVVMVLPVLRGVAIRYPDLEVVLVSQPFAAGLLGQMERVRLIPAKIRSEHRGWRGLWHLSRAVASAGPYDGVADLHGVIRARLLLLFLWLRRAVPLCGVVRIRKGRSAKRALTRTARKRLVQLEHTVHRYADCFARLGLQLEVPCRLGGLSPGRLSLPAMGQLPNAAVRVGLAPFAQHRGKAYPLARGRELLGLLRGAGYGVYLFGGGGREAEVLAQWAGEWDGVVAVPQLGLAIAEEVRLMASLDAMIAMDSGNMHLASWAGVRVVSVWGATHPYAGFLGWGQRMDDAVGRSDLACRPCSVFGNKPCVRGDYACLDIPPGLIVRRLQAILAERRG